jgi:hypothetical protein
VIFGVGSGGVNAECCRAVVSDHHEGEEMDAIKGFVLGEFGFEFFILGLIAAAVSIFRHPRPRRREVVD